MRYWDSSALVPLLVDEPMSAPLRVLLKGDPVRVTWWGTPVECWSALQRYRRTEGLSPEDFLAVRRGMERLFQEVDSVAPSGVLRERAVRVLSTHFLTAADALQLASALIWTEERPAGRQLVCLDERLKRAALAEGFTVLP